MGAKVGGLLVIFSGLPGVGKSTLARALAERIGAVYVRVDSVEQALRGSMLQLESIEDLGYLAGYAVVADNLGLGQRVVADSVNPWERTRSAWRNAAKTAGAATFDVEVICSDAGEHRRRVETRKVDVPGLILPTWQEVIDRDYHTWTTERLVVDTFDREVDACLEQISEWLS